MRKSLFLAALASLAVAQNTTNLTNPNIASLVQVVGSRPDLSAAAGYFSKIARFLGNFENVTVFAPTNAAFSVYVNTSTAHAEDTHPELVLALFSYHILNGVFHTFGSEAFYHSTLRPGILANVTGGQNLDVSGLDLHSGLLSHSSIVGEPLNFTGGVIYAIDKVLTLPQNLSLTAEVLNLTAAWRALEDANLATAFEEVPDVTLFIPSNAAFQDAAPSLAQLDSARLSSLLYYHAVFGSVAFSTSLSGNYQTLKAVDGKDITLRDIDGELYANDARVIVPNVLVANGVVHVIDGILTPNKTSQMPPINSTQITSASAAAGASTSVTSALTASGNPSALSTGYSGTPSASAPSGSVTPAAASKASVKIDSAKAVTLFTVLAVMTVLLIT